MIKFINFNVDTTKFLLFIKILIKKNLLDLNEDGQAVSA